MKQKFKVGDRIIFNCAFENADARIERGGEGMIKSKKGPLGFYSVVAKGMLWLCKENEIRKEI